MGGVTLQDMETEGPTRVYPGGLKLTRSIGNLKSCPATIPTPEVTVTELPREGARIVLATNGLWNAVGNKQVGHSMNIQ
jgi:serine/threonine protein phosphatase PrpC